MTPAGPPARPRVRPGSARRQASRLSRIVIAACAAAAVAAGGAFLYQRIAQVQQGVIAPRMPRGAVLDPALKAQGAAATISGDASHPLAAYDPASGTVTVRFQSRYYDPRHSAALNRQYLATEGRLVVQLVLYEAPEVGRAVAELYRGRRLLATVSGHAGQAYANYAVQYARGLP